MYVCVCVAHGAFGGRQVVKTCELLTFPWIIAIRVFKQEDKRAVGELEKGSFLAGHTPQGAGLANGIDVALSRLYDPTTGCSFT